MIYIQGGFSTSVWYVETLGNQIQNPCLVIGIQRSEGFPRTMESTGKPTCATCAVFSVNMSFATSKTSAFQQKKYVMVLQFRPQKGAFFGAEHLLNVFGSQRPGWVDWAD